MKISLKKVLMASVILVGASNAAASTVPLKEDVSSETTPRLQRLIISAEVEAVNEVTTAQEAGVKAPGEKMTAALAEFEAVVKELKNAQKEFKDATEELDTARKQVKDVTERSLSAEERGTRIVVSTQSTLSTLEETLSFIEDIEDVETDVKDANHHLTAAYTRVKTAHEQVKTASERFDPAIKKYFNTLLDTAAEDEKDPTKLLQLLKEAQKEIGKLYGVFLDQ